MSQTSDYLPRVPLSRMLAALSLTSLAMTGCGGGASHSADPIANANPLLISESAPGKNQGRRPTSGDRSSGPDSTAAPTYSSDAGMALAPALGALPLLTESNVSAAERYIGSFRVPSDPGLAHPQNWSGSYFRGAPGTNVWFNESGNAGSGSLIIAGRSTENASYLTEISVPDDGELVKINLSSALNRARFLVPAPYFFDLTEGRAIHTSPGDTNGVISGGVFIADGNLYQNFGSFYQGLTSTVATHFKRSGTAVHLGTTSGPFAFAPAPIDSTSGVYSAPLWYRGPVAAIPADWHSALGGRFIQSQTQYSNPEPMGNGPALFAFDPANLGTSGAAPNTVLAAYTTDRPLELTPAGGSAKAWLRQVSAVNGVVFPSGTRSVLVSTKLGIGPYTYGSVGQLDVMGSGIVITDPVLTDKGHHAHPYVIRILAYDAAELKQVRDGQKKPYEVRPYASWSVDLPVAPGLSVGGHSGTHALAYDQGRKRLFLIERETARSQGDPIVHVFQLNH